MKLPRGVRRPLRLGMGTLVGAAFIVTACGGSSDDAADQAPAPSPAVTSTETAPTVAETTPTVAEGVAGEGVIPGEGAYDWQVIRVDRGTKPGIALSSEGEPLLAYMLERQVGQGGFVKFATVTGGAITVEVIEEQDYYYGPLDIESGPGGEVIVGYHHHSWEDGAVAVRRDGSWRIARISDDGHDGWDSALAVGENGELVYIGIDPEQFRGVDGVEIAVRDGDAWTVEAVGSGPQPYEWGTDVAFAADGTLHIVYFDAQTQDLVYGRQDADGWQLESAFVEGDVGRFPVLRIDAAGQPHVAFIQSTGTFSETGRNEVEVVYGSRGDDGWTFETVGRLQQLDAGFEGARRSVALSLDQADEPTLAFIDSRELVLATRSGDGAWTLEQIVEADGAPLQFVGLALDSEGAPHLTFSTTTANGPLDGEVWYIAPKRKAN